MLRQTLGCEGSAAEGDPKTSGAFLEVLDLGVRAENLVWKIFGQHLQAEGTIECVQEPFVETLNHGHPQKQKPKT